MKKFGVFLIATVGFASLAHAADLLPTTKAPAPAPANCYASVWTWLELDTGGLPAELGALHRLCDA